MSESDLNEIKKNILKNYGAMYELCPILNKEPNSNDVHKVLNGILSILIEFEKELRKVALKSDNDTSNVKVDIAKILCPTELVIFKPFNLNLGFTSIDALSKIDTPNASLLAFAILQSSLKSEDQSEELKTVNDLLIKFVEKCFNSEKLSSLMTNPNKARIALLAMNSICDMYKHTLIMKILENMKEDSDSQDKVIEDITTQFLSEI